MAGSTFNTSRDRLGRFKNYPSPFFDIASTYVPPSLKEMFKWVKYLYYSNSVVSPIIYKMSEYPITRLIYEDAEEPAKQTYKKLLENTLHIKRLLIEIGLDYHVYGNCLISINYPFVRNLKCLQCKTATLMNKMKWKWQNNKFEAICPHCKTGTVHEIDDVKVKNRTKISVVRWNPFNIDIDYNDITGESFYTYRIPPKMRRSVLAGMKNIMETTPKVFIEAAISNRDVEIDKGNLYHFKRPSIADNDMGWGMPLIMPVMKDLFYNQVLRKAQEAIAMDHITPLRIVFPSMNADVTPYVNINLQTWKGKVEEEINKWRQDPNYISVFPVPMGVENIGGDAKALQMVEEFKLSGQMIAGGLGIPQELLYGGMSYSGSSVSLRVVENGFLSYREMIQEFLSDFLVPNLRRYFRLPVVNVRLQDFKMAEDIQKKQIAINLKASGDMSTKTLINELGYDYEHEIAEMEKEIDDREKIDRKKQLLIADIQGEAALITAKYQAQAQMQAAEAEQAATPPEVHEENMNAQQKQEQMQAEQAKANGGQNGKPGKGKPAQKPQQDPKAQAATQAQGQETNQQAIQGAQAYAQQLMRLAPDQREAALARIAQSTPQVAALVKRLMTRMSKDTVDMRPLPEQKPPRRTNSPI